MIVKKVKREQSGKPKAWQIGDLVDYIRSPHTTNAHEKIAHAGSRNFLSGTHSGQRGEMIALAQESVHSTMPVSHWIFSWKENEQPTRAQVDELVDIFLEHMGLKGHQAVYGLHRNTDNYHVHIAVNRTHPYTLKVVRPNNGFDIETAHKIVALVEHKQGWASEENTRYTVLENGEVIRARREQKIQPRPEARDFERATGEKSAQRIAQERGYGIIKNAVSWVELHRELAAKGLLFEKKGSGAILWVGDIAVKASSVDRAFGMSTLCKRLGEFMPAETFSPVESVRPEPVSAVNLKEWQEYQKERAATPSTETKQVDQLISHIRQKALKERQRAERGCILPGFAEHGLSFLNIARHFLKVKQREEARQLRQELRSPKYRPSFEGWLRERGLHMQADQWRFRKGFEPPAQCPSAQAAQGNAAAQQPVYEGQQFERYAAAVGADRYRVTCIRLKRNGTKQAFILDKTDGASKGFTPEELQARIPTMLRLQNRRENIYYTPLSATRHHILIDDMSRESMEKLYEDGFRPAVVLESSPDNFQCVLTIPKLQSVHDRDVGNRLTEHLNRQYGDTKLSGCIHTHRAPGFGNFKPQHQREDGGFPRVKLLAAEKRECTKALELSRQIALEYTNAAEAKRQQTHPRPQATQSSHPGATVAAYYAHFENVKRHLNMEDMSRVDSMIALRLRATGHSPQAVTDAIIQCAPTIRQGRAKNEGRDWHRYAERTTAYAFGVAGDVALARNERYLEHWRKIEGVEVERQEQQKQELPRLWMR